MMTTEEKTEIAVKELTKESFKILLVDDDAVIIGLVDSFLEKAGYKCTYHTDSEVALQDIKENTYDLIISDIHMPGVSGLELAEHLRDSAKDTMIILITGYTEYNDASRALKVRPFGYVEKPFTPQEMLDVIDKAFKHRQKEIEEKHLNLTIQNDLDEKTRELEFKNERLLKDKEMSGIIGNANFGLIAIDSSDTVHLMNKFAVETLNMNEEYSFAYHGLPLSVILPESYQETFADLKNKVVQTQEIVESDFTDEDKDRKLNIISYPVTFRNVTSAIIYVIHDITEKDNLQKRLLQTAKLASIGELAAGVAHEINNPLGFVTSNCNTLSDYIEDIKKYLEILEKAAQSPEIAAAKEELDIDYIKDDIGNLFSETLDGLSRVSKIVKDLKTFARVDSDTPEQGNLNNLIDDALNLVRNETKYNLTIEKSFTELDDIACYPNQLVQVFTNLFINAAHAAKEKGNLSITTLKDKHKIYIKIKDDGAGIPEKILSKIFDPFFTTKAPGKGTGMGLSISHSIIEKHLGSISVESKLGVGTEFTITLPLGGIPDTSEAPLLEAESA